MEISPEYAEDQRMSDVAMARDYVDEIGGEAKINAKLLNTYNLLVELFPKSRWTFRRVRSFWNLEAATVEFREMIELHSASKEAEARREKAELLRQARKQHAAFIERTARNRSLLERQDAAFHSPQIRGMERGLCGVDRARTQREPGD